ncbi:endonuclease domain-containing protein [Humibacter antri]
MLDTRNRLVDQTGVLSIGHLRRSGLSRSDIQAALDRGDLSRIRRGWYARDTSDADAVEAVFLGGALTSVSAAPFRGLWTLRDGLLHIAVPHNASRLRTARNNDEVLVDRRGNRICLHWTSTQHPFAEAVADVHRVLMDAAVCQPADHVVVLADSALNRGIVTPIEIEACLPLLADRCTGASESGTETMVRLHLRRRGVRVRCQVWIGSVGVVDLLVGDRLVIECDSAKYHDGYQSARDYDRDLALVEMGFIVVRLRYDHVIHHWDRVERAILSIVRDRRHLRRGREHGEHLLFG